MIERSLEQTSRLMSVASKFVPTERVARSLLVGTFAGIADVAVFKAVGIERSNEYFATFAAANFSATYVVGLGHEKIPKVYRKVVKTIVDRSK